MMNNVRFALFLAVVVCVTLSLSAGVVIVQEGGEPGKDKMKFTMFVEGGKIRVETTMADGRKTIAIFDGDKQVMWMLQPEQHTYMEMNAASMEGMSQQLAQAQQKMQAAMANMPPEQRAQMEKAMAGRGGMGGASAPKTITFQPKGGTDHVGKFTCTLYTELTNGQRTAELCATSLDQVPFKEADLRAFKAMAKFGESMSKMGGRGGYTPPSVEQLHGYPVHSVQYDGARATYEMTVLSIDQKSVDPGMFAIPAGYTKQDMMGGRGGRGPQN